MDIEEADALGHMFEEIDIYSNSWGQADDGNNVQELGMCTEKTFEKAATMVKKDNITLLC